MQLLKIFGSRVIEIQPLKYLNKYDQVCTTCKSKVKNYDSIKVCECQLITHKGCFIEKIKNETKKYNIIRCLGCQEKIKFSLKYSYKVSCQRVAAIQKIVFILGLFILLCLFGMASLDFYTHYISQTAVYIILIMLTTFLCLTFFFSCTQRKLSQIDVKERKEQEQKEKIEEDRLSEQFKENQKINNDTTSKKIIK